MTGISGPQANSRSTWRQMPQGQAALFPAMAMAMKRRCPAATAQDAAQRSAQMVAP